MLLLLMLLLLTISITKQGRSWTQNLGGGGAHLLSLPDISHETASNYCTVLKKYSLMNFRSKIEPDVGYGPAKIAIAKFFGKRNYSC